MTEQRSDQPPKGETMAAGLYAVGHFLGVEAARSFTRQGTNETVNVRPRLGLRIDDDEIEVAAKDDDHLRQVTSSWAKGQLVRVPVEVRPPFGSPRNAALSFALPGVIQSKGREWK